MGPVRHWVWFAWIYMVLGMTSRIRLKSCHSRPQRRYDAFRKALQWMIAKLMEGLSLVRSFIWRHTTNLKNDSHRLMTQVSRESCTINAYI
ncbi:hypothetical protein IW261DRAFT_1480955 [Armillaria novae-zelandiae]|uniref:Uncharacterized protein n=1 Tax=Armillaria novae-zelandiae TaxID=153914 RepID=A0AA39P7D3_9AGAR|nr:hypothetical protein IW261DRAFT_1480955 [Armillaria novae-zelandiae]